MSKQNFFLSLLPMLVGVLKINEQENIVKVATGSKGVECTLSKFNV